MATLSVAVMLTLGAAVGVGATAGVRTETRAGLIPNGAETTSDPSLDFVLTPSGSLSLSRGDSAFTVGYNVRMLRRFFVDTIDRFILLHNANVGYGDTFGRGWRLNVSMSGTVGEVDYAGQTSATTPQAQTGNNPAVQNNGNAVNAPIVPLLNVSGVMALNGAIGRSHGLGFNVTVNHLRAIGTPVNVNETFSDTLGAGIGTAYRYTATARLGFVAGAGVNFTTFNDPAGMGSENFGSGSANLGVTYQFSATSGAGLQLGALVSNGTGGFLASPTGTLTYNVNFSNTAALRIDGRAQARVDGQPNQVTETFDPRFSSSVSVGGTIGSDWTVRIEGQFTTPLPIDPSDATMPNEEATTTFIGGAIPITYRINDAVDASFGVRAQVQGPRLDSEMFTLVAPSITGFVAISATVGTGR